MTRGKTWWHEERNEVCWDSAMCQNSYLSHLIQLMLHLIQITKQEDDCSNIFTDLLVSSIYKIITKRTNSRDLLVWLGIHMMLEEETVRFQSSYIINKIRDLNKYHWLSVNDWNK